MSLSARQVSVLGIAAVLAAFAFWHALTVYAPFPHDRQVDPRPRATMHAVLVRALARDSIGAVRAGARPAAAAWALAAARGDSATVRGWADASETEDVGRAGDTIARVWFTTASLQRCMGAAALRARFVVHGDRLTLLDLQSPCAPLAPITFSTGQGSVR